MASLFPSSSPYLRSKLVYTLLSVLILLLFFVYTPVPDGCEEDGDGVVCKVTQKTKGVLPPAFWPSHEQWRPAELTGVKSKRAFATFLAGEEDSDENDPYFVAVRVLTYQLLHAKETASRDRSIPFVVMATKNVSESKRNRLRKDGAIVVVGDWLYADWVQAATSAWRDIMVKLRLWELTQFDRIAMLDGDTVLTEPIDGIFDDPAVTMQTTLDLADAIKDDEQPLPEKYAFAGIPEMSHEHGYPPTDEHHDFMNINYFNGGFFVFQPSLEAFNYYTSLLQIPGRFDPSMMEQNLLNYAHRRDGNMPWQQLGNTWNIHYPTVADLDGGVKSLHEKWWTPEHADLKPYLESWRWQMKGYFEARDKLLGKDYDRHGLGVEVE